MGQPNKNFIVNDIEDKENQESNEFDKEHLEEQKHQYQMYNDNKGYEVTKDPKFGYFYERDNVEMNKMEQGHEYYNNKNNSFIGVDVNNVNLQNSYYDNNENYRNTIEHENRNNEFLHDYNPSSDRDRMDDMRYNTDVYENWCSNPQRQLYNPMYSNFQHEQPILHVNNENKFSAIKKNKKCKIGKAYEIGVQRTYLKEAKKTYQENKLNQLNTPTNSVYGNRNIGNVKDIHFNDDFVNKSPYGTNERLGVPNIKIRDEYAGNDEQMIYKENIHNRNLETYYHNNKSPYVNNRSYNNQHLPKYNAELLHNFDVNLPIVNSNAYQNNDGAFNQTMNNPYMFENVSNESMLEYNRTDEYLYSCDPCMKKFKRLSTLKIHIFSHLKEAFIYKCPKQSCETGFKSQSIALKHIIHFHREEKNGLIENLKKSKFISVFRSFTTLIDYYKQFRTGEANPFVGNFCFGCFTYPRSLPDHPCTKMFYTLTQCPSCKSEVNYGELENHIFSEGCRRSLPTIKNMP